MKSKNLLAFLNILFITLQFVFIQINPVVVVNASTWTTYSIQDTYRDSYRVGINYYYDGVINPIQHSNWDCYDYVLFNYVIGNASWLKSAILSVPCYSASDYNGIDYATVYGLKNPSLAHLLTEPTTPVTTAYSNMVINSDWINYKNVTVTTVVKEIMQLSNWTSGSSNICFKILEPFNVSQPDRYIYDYSAGSNVSKLYLEFYEAGEKPYEGGWDHGYLNWTYPDYDQWIVWNGTDQLSYVFWNDTSNYWQYSNGVSSYNILSMATEPTNTWTQSTNNLIEYNDILYTIVLNYQTSHHHTDLYKSINAGVTWSLVTNIDAIVSSACWGLDIVGDVIYISQGDDNHGLRLYTYDIGTNTVLGYISPSVSGMYQNRGHAFTVSDDGTKIFLVYFGTNAVTGYTPTLTYSLNSGSTWTKQYMYTGTAVTMFMYVGSAFVDIYEADGLLHGVFGCTMDTGAVWLEYIDHDITFSSLEYPQSSSVYLPSTAFIEDENTIHVFYHQGSSNPSYHKYKIRTGEKTGATYSTANYQNYMANFTAITYNMEVCPIENFESFYVEYGLTSSRVQYYYNGSYGSFSSSSTIFPFTNLKYLSIVNLGNLTISYTQKHWVNCTWDDPICVDCEEPPCTNCDDWTDPIIGDANRIKLSVLLLGLFLITSGLGKFALDFRFEEIGVIIFVILIGVALLVSMPYIN